MRLRRSRDDHNRSDGLERGNGREDETPQYGERRHDRDQDHPPGAGLAALEAAGEQQQGEQRHQQAGERVVAPPRPQCEPEHSCGREHEGNEYAQRAPEPGASNEQQLHAPPPLLRMRSAASSTVATPAYQPRQMRLAAVV